MGKRRRSHLRVVDANTIDAITWGAVEAEQEVWDWLVQLSTAQFMTTSAYLRMLAEHGPLLGEPHTRQLSGKLRELRFHLDRNSIRITYWIRTGRRIVLLTVFTKKRMRETREVDRALRALARCADRHNDEGDQ